MEDLAPVEAPPRKVRFPLQSLIVLQYRRQTSELMSVVPVDRRSQSPGRFAAWGITRP